MGFVTFVTGVEYCELLDYVIVEHISLRGSYARAWSMAGHVDSLYVVVVDTWGVVFTWLVLLGMVTQQIQRTTGSYQTRFQFINSLSYGNKRYVLKVKQTNTN